MQELAELAVILSRGFPGWLPWIVAVFANNALANNIISSNNSDRELIWRLTTDPRMERVWPQIANLKGEWPPFGLTLAGNPRKKLTSVKHPQLTKRDENLVNFFGWAYLLAHAPIEITTIAELDARLASCTNMSKQLRKLAATLRALPSRLSGSDRLDVESVEHRTAESHAKQIEDAANFCDNAAPTIKELKASAGFNPQVVERAGNHRHRRARAYIRQLAAQIKQPLYETIATVASVTLDCCVTKQQVIDWTRGIDRPQNST
jgi:hypothetical protein